MANKKTIGKWLVDAKEHDAKYVIVWCDTFDWSDYPVYCDNAEQVSKRIKASRGNTDMIKIMEIYNLDMSIKKQLDEKRAWNI
jgi:hypothetical protein